MKTFPELSLCEAIGSIIVFSCTELVGHKIARLNHKSFFYLNHHPLVHFLSDRSQQKVILHYSLFQLLRFKMSIKKG